MAQTNRQVAVEPIRLSFGDERPVVVTPEDEDRFMTTAEDAARACEQAQDVLKWKKEFDRLLTYIHAWCLAHEGDVVRAYLAFSSDGLHVFILTSGDQYRFDFDDAVTALDIDLVDRFERCPTEITQIPSTPIGSLTSFFDPGATLQIYGD